MKSQRALLLSGSDIKFAFENFDGGNEIAVELVERSFQRQLTDDVLTPAKTSLIFDETLQNRINCLQAAYLSEKIFGIKIVSVFPNNPLQGYRNVSGVIVLSEIEHGSVIAVMDAAYITCLRTAAIGAVAAKFLARKDSEIIGFIGAGIEARRHFELLTTVCPKIRECRVSSRRLTTVEEFIAKESPTFPDVRFVANGNDYETTVREADIIVTATSAQNDFLKAKWIKKGAFYIHVGGWEDEFAVPKMASKIVCDEWERVKHRTQTISRMYKGGLLKDEDIYADLVDIVGGLKNGRENKEEFIYFNSVGLPSLDVMFAYYAYQFCLKNEKGAFFNF